MATQREMIEFILSFKGEDADLRKTLQLLEKMESTMQRVQTRAQQGYVDVNTGASAALRQRALQSQANGQIVSTFAGVTNARQLKGFNDPEVLRGVQDVFRQERLLELQDR